MTGRMLNDRLGKLHFWLLFVGFLVTFGSIYALGLLGMPRRVYTFADDLGWNTLNLVSTLGGYVIAAGLIVFLVNVGLALRRGPAAGDDPWDAWTLEWATTSPPPPYNFSSLPPVLGSRPLWDAKHPDRADYLTQGGEILTLMGPTDLPEDEARVTGGTRAPAGGKPAEEPEHVAATSAFPVLTVVGLLGMAVGAVLLSWQVVAMGGVFVLGALIGWLWEPWEVYVGAPAGAPTAEKPGEPGQSRVPRAGSIARLGVLTFIASETIFFLVILAGYAHIRLMMDMWPPDGLPRVELTLPIVNTGILLISGLTAHWGLEELRSRREGRFRFLVVVTILLGLAFLGIQAYEYVHAGFSLDSGAMGSTFFTVTGFHGAHVAGGVAVLVMMLAASWGARLRPDSRGLAEGGVLYWHFVDAVWIAILLLVYIW